VQVVNSFLSISYYHRSFAAAAFMFASVILFLYVEVRVVALDSRNLLLVEELCDWNRTMNPVFICAHFVSISVQETNAMNIFKFM
jgi:hypothetical protein